MHKYPLCGMTADNIYKYIEQYNFSHNHAVKVATWLYRRKINDFRQIMNLPKSLKDLLYANFFPGIFSPVTSETSIDKTVKYLFRSESGSEFETVFLPDYKRNTVCVSTQAGCRMGCSLCLTGRYGFHGNLTAGEIVNQIISLPESSKITHIVLMGMGEPLDNLEEVIKACSIITSEWGLAISPRNVTVSTVGIMPAIKEFLVRSDCNLTLSLHSPFPGERRVFVPVEKQFPVLEIIEIMKTFPLKKNRRLSLAYVMIKEINDTDKHLKALIALLRGTSIRINLLPYHKETSDINVSSSAERMQYFKHNLVISGISASIRRTRGEDICAACGLLASGLTKNNVVALHLRQQ
jgi:23S rRNA (adenine2503-C2)-methyltransferase